MKASPSTRRAVFADRDGTIIEDHQYTADPDRVSLIPGAADALLRLRELGFALVIVTNQSGIGRGLYTPADYHRVAAEVARQLAHAGVIMDGTYFCPDGPGGDPHTTCRKPSPVMYRRAAADLGLETAGSYYVGDKRSDVLPARTLGGTGILVRTGHGAGEEDRVGGETHVVDDLAAAAALIERLEGGAAAPAIPFVDPLPGHG
ncbi:MAG: HAD family hydrolase [Gemmatimonadota bacterium]|nr:HAD family hydrolase [Gemmatimonadota bacterium]MDE2983887.1 HAD family hydrolase [Gemmatimonadota bacterium]